MKAKIKVYVGRFLDAARHHALATFRKHPYAQSCTIGQPDGSYVFNKGQDDQPVFRRYEDLAETGGQEDFHADS